MYIPYATPAPEKIYFCLVLVATTFVYVAIKPTCTLSESILPKRHRQRRKTQKNHVCVPFSREMNETLIIIVSPSFRLCSL